MTITSELNNSIGPNVSYQEQIKNAWFYYDEGQNEQVEEIINSLQKVPDPTSEIQISLLLLQNAILIKKRTDIKKSYDLAIEAMNLALKEDNKSLVAESYVALLNSLILLGNPLPIPDLMKKANDLFESYIASNEEHIAIQIRFLMAKSFYHSILLNKYDLALDELLKCAELQKKYNKITSLLNSLTKVSQLYKLLGEFQSAIENLLYLIDLIENLHQKKYTEALSYALVVLGDIYNEQGELDKSLECANKALRLTNEYLTKFNCLEILGFIFLQKNDLDNAIFNFKSAIDLSIDNGGSDAEIYGLVYLLITFIQKKDRENQELTFEKINTLYDKNKDNQFYIRFFLFSKAMMLKENKRFTDKAEAEKIFKELIKDKEYDYFGIQSFLNYLELLFEELKFNNDVSVLNEIEQVNKQLMILAKTNSLHAHIAESMLIEAKISILKLDLEGARKILDQAQTSAEEKGLKLLSQKISKEHDNLLNKMNEWEDVVNESMSYQERLELANIEEFLRSMIRKSASGIQEEQDKGLIFLIVNISGLAIFSRNFGEEDSVEEQLIAGLLSAINSFSQNTFKTDQPIERIKQGENTLIIKKISNFTICYAFKGPSYYANKKMNEIYFKIRENNEVLDELTNRQNFLSKSVIKQLNEIVEESFTKST